MAACAVDCMSAEIGSASDAAANGIISYANTVAAGLGIAAGQSVSAALDRLEQAPAPHAMLPEVAEARWDQEVGGISVLCVDSASLIDPGDAGRVIITGSHGGLIGGNPARACKAEARYVSFSDAGRGKNDAGVMRLPALDTRGIAAVTLASMSCEIGNAASALNDGVVSAVNRTARDAGIRVGMSHRDALAALCKGGQGRAT